MRTFALVGLETDAEKNRTLIELEGKLSTAGSSRQALVVLTEEGCPRMHPCTLMASFVAFLGRNPTVGSAL